MSTTVKQNVKYEGAEMNESIKICKLIEKKFAVDALWFHDAGQVR